MRAWPPVRGSPHERLFETGPITVTQVVREHYLREDIYSGTPLDPECDASAYKLSPDAARYLVLDTNVALHQVGEGAGRALIDA